MPKIYEIRGFKLFFFSNKGYPLERCHIHIRKGASIAKFRLDNEVSLENSWGFNSKELKFIESVVIEKQEMIRGKWNEYFN